MTEMIRANAIRIAALLVCTAVAGVAAPLLVSSRGAPSPLVIGTESGVIGIIAATFAVLVCAVIGGVAGRFLNTTAGIFIAGFGMGVLAWRMGVVTELGLLGRQGMVIPEAIVLAILALGAALVVFAIAGPVKDVEPDAGGTHPHPFTSIAAVRSCLGALAVVPVVLFLAASPVKGQVLAAAIVAGIVSGLVGRLASPHVQPILLIPATVLGGLIAYLAGQFLIDGTFADAAALRRLPTLVRPMPIDYLAGSFLGVSIGLSWATSFLEHEDDDDDDAMSSGEH